MVPHFWERAWLVRERWARAEPLFTSGGGVQGVRDASCSITKGGRCRDKTRWKMLDSVTIRWWMIKKAAQNNFSSNNETVVHPPQVGGKQRARFQLIYLYSPNWAIPEIWCQMKPVFCLQWLKKNYIFKDVNVFSIFLFIFTGGAWVVGELWLEVLFCWQIQRHRLVMVH